MGGGCSVLSARGGGCDEDVDPGEEGGDGALAQQLHLHVDEEVLGLAHLPLQVDGPHVAAELPGAEVGLVVAPHHAYEDVVAGVGRRRPDAEDLSRGDDVGLEAELVVGDAQRRVEAVQGVGGAAGPLAPPAGGAMDDSVYSQDNGNHWVYIYLNLSLLIDEIHCRKHFRLLMIHSVCFKNENVVTE